jgi:hypothetical protein
VSCLKTSRTIPGEKVSSEGCIGLAEHIITCHVSIFFFSERSPISPETKDKMFFLPQKPCLGTEAQRDVGKALQFLFQLPYFTAITFEPRQTASESSSLHLFSFLSLISPTQNPSQ